MKKIFITRHLALKTAGDYRVLLTSVSQSGSISGSDGDVILDVMNQRIVKYTAVDVLQFPLEEDVVYFDQSATSNQLLMWTGTEVAAIGSVTAIAGVTVDAWNTGTYVIATDITTTLAPANNSTLIFEGGVLQVGLIGDQTVIQASPMRIFADNCQVSGSFVTQEAYPEWWGAVPSPNNIHTPSADTTDNAVAINAAFNSCFGVIRFCAGNYYVYDPLVLTKAKTIKMIGIGMGSGVQRDNDLTTVIWTNRNIDVLTIELDYQETQKGHLLIEGGEINVKECKGDTGTTCYTSNAITVKSTGMIGAKISTSIVGPIGYIGLNADKTVDWEHSTCHQPTKDEVENHNYKGTGILLTDPGHAPDKTKGEQNILYLLSLECYIVGFGQGIAVKYNTAYGDMTSLHVNCYIVQCFTYVNAPSRAFNGGVLEGTIQTSSFNAKHHGTGYTEALIKGDFREAYINPRIWDASRYVDFFNFSSAKDVRFGQRIIETMKFRSRRMGMPIQNLMTLTSEEQSPLLGAMGNHDVQQLSAVNTVVQADNFVHFIDNDLLGIDRMIQNCHVTITPNDKFEGFQVLNGSSIFDRNGLSITFTNTANNDDAELVIECDMRRAITGFGWSARLQMLAIHLKGSGYNHFENLKIENTITIPYTTNEVTTTYFDDEYASIPMSNGLYDVIIPLLNRHSDDSEEYSSTANDPDYQKNLFSLGKLTLTFSKLRIAGPVWGNECFKIAIEGRLNRREKSNIWSTVGGELGNHINRYGKPYIIGTKTIGAAGQSLEYDTLQSLPSNASVGAIGVVANTYPVVKTTQGWIVQNLIGTLSQIQSVMSSIGTFTVGQTAVATNLNKMIWWTGSVWKDAMGSTVS